MSDSLNSDQFSAILRMRHAALEVSEAGLLAFHATSPYHLERLEQQVERLQGLIDAYREAMGKGAE